MMHEEATITASPGEWLELAGRLQREGFDQLCDLTCVDWYPEPDRFEIVCQLYSTKTARWQRLKTRCSEEAPAPSLSPLWPCANWFEREVYDLFGVRFLGHPDLTRMMMPDDFEGHPLRKDYPVEGYR
ncbi:MAG: NADH-quinone oxidoreductase subunit C [Terriglobales bacterium]